ncbi:hypothetical protein, partial [Escherichia coli]|uniref:hypothetical protein n=1 Tax=Escherichia coli TaxID=562 RepID=UPI0019538369
MTTSHKTATGAGDRPATDRPKHFIDLSDFAGSDLRAILDRARDLKRVRRTPKADKPLAGKVLA